MIPNPVFFSKFHIETNRFNAPATLAEEAVHCLELVAELVEAGLDFQFKGGNSLLLILPEPKRFSIDVDIATDEPRERIEECLDRTTVRRVHALRKTAAQDQTVAADSELLPVFFTGGQA